MKLDRNKRWILIKPKGNSVETYKGGRRMKVWDYSVGNGVVFEIPDFDIDDLDDEVMDRGFEFGWISMVEWEMNVTMTPGPDEGFSLTDWEDVLPRNTLIDFAWDGQEKYWIVEWEEEE